MEIETLIAIKKNPAVNIIAGQNLNGKSIS